MWQLKRLLMSKKKEYSFDYIREAANLQFSVTLKDVKVLAYQFTMINQIEYPPTWDSEKIAGEYWQQLFRTRFRNAISLRKPEATNWARSSTFIKHTVELTFNNHKKHCLNVHLAYKLYRYDRVTYYACPFKNCGINRS